MFFKQAKLIETLKVQSYKIVVVDKVYYIMLFNVIVIHRTNLSFDYSALADWVTTSISAMAFN